MGTCALLVFESATVVGGVPEALHARLLSNMKIRLPLQIHISTLLTLMVLLAGGLVGGFAFKQSRSSLEMQAIDVSRRVTSAVATEVRSLVMPAVTAVTALGYSSIPEASTLGGRLKRLGLLIELMNDSPVISSIYIGYETGDFFFVHQLSDEIAPEMFEAPVGARYVVRSIEHGAQRPKGTLIFLDANLQTLREEDDPDYAKQFDPRHRDWYANSWTATGTTATPPYRFFTDRKVGTTIARRAPNGRAVVGADILLEEVDAHLMQQRVSPSEQLIIVNAGGLIVASATGANEPSAYGRLANAPELTNVKDTKNPLLASVVDTISAMNGEDSVTKKVNFDGVDWRINVNRVVVLQELPALFLMSAIPERELLGAAFKLASATAWIMLGIVLLMIPLALLIGRGISGSLRLLSKEARAIQNFEFSRPIHVESMILEVDEVAKTMQGMKQTIHRFLEVSRAVASEDNFDRLLPMLLRETISASDADAGALYLVDESTLVPAALRCQGVDSAGSGLPVPLAQVHPLITKAIETGCVQAGAVSRANIESVGLGALPVRASPDQVLVVPLHNRQKKLLGIALLVHERPITEAQVSFIHALTTASATSLETRELIKMQKELFEAFIQLIAGAIDAKSPYTGAHCKRVPELTKMLVRAACAQTSGPFSDFQLSEQEWEAVHIGAWLHDCGKIVTPVDVVDKATKLETIYDRIHEIRTRFEVLKRDAEIRCLQAIISGAEEGAARALLADEIRQLDDEFSFVASCNLGGEFMSDDKVARLKSIAGRTWLRTIDKRIGVSGEELERMGQEAAALPVAEPLLADQPEHRRPRKAQDHIPENNEWGFRMPEPELLYNRGELYNLSIGRGTLAEEERHKINEHMTQTIMMLTALPFPKHLRSVPEIAGGHHEKMDGTGYPKRLMQAELSPITRMMAIADIFEALTAIDRPYKKGKTVSEAIKIMSFMKKDKHIDAEAFDLFLCSAVYREYAERYLTPEQIDEVEIEKYLG